MRNALKISAGLHALLIVASLVSIPWFDRNEEETIRVAQVSILTESQFDAAVSQAPQTVPMTTLDALAAPGEENLDAARPDAEMDVTINELDGPDAPTEADAQADLSAVSAPILNITGRHDVIVTTECSQAMLRYVSSRDVTRRTIKGGHVSIVSSETAMVDTWREMADWLIARD